MVKDEIKSDFPLESKRKRSRSSSSSSSSSSSRSRQSKKSIKRRSRKSKKHSRHRSRSPRYYHRRRYYGTREYPYMSRIIGVFGLSNVTDEAKLLEVFSRYGAIEHVQIIQDAKTGYSRGFGFIYFKEISHAVAARKESNGMMLDGRQIRVDFSITKRAHTPTPGAYMGLNKSRERDRSGHRRSRHSYSKSSRHGRSRSRRRSSTRYERSRSR